MTTTIASGVDSSAKIDASARIDESAVIGPDVEIGPDVIIGPHVVIGARCVLMARSIVIAHTVMGEGNVIHPNAVIGGDPQDRAYKPEVPGRLIIGHRNVFREGVTLHRSTGDAAPTRIGDDCYLMANSHVGHNAQIGNFVTMANSAMIAGHAHIGNNVVLSGACAVHQFINVGELVMFQGLGAASMNVPPCVVMSTGTNTVAGLNIVGLRRAKHFTDLDRVEIKELYRAFYRTRGGRPLNAVLVEKRAEKEWGAAANRWLNFIESALTQNPPRKRGIATSRTRARSRGGDDVMD